jgi:hypothetical protein
MSKNFQAEDRLACRPGRVLNAALPYPDFRKAVRVDLRNGATCPLPDVALESRQGHQAQRPLRGCGIAGFRLSREVIDRHFT